MLALALALLACSSPAPQSPAAGPARQAVRVALNWFPEPEFGGFYEGVLGGIYAEAGFDVTLLPGGASAPTLELLLSGSADVAVVSADELLLKREKGIQALGVWPAFQWSPVGLMVHPESGVQRFEDIQQGRIAMGVGDPFQRFLWNKFGWEGKVELLPNTGAVASFLADSSLIQQGYITAEPCAVRAQGGDLVFLRGADAGWNPYASLLAVPDPPPDWAAKFVAATQRAWESYVASPDRANQEIGRLNSQMTPDVLRCVTEAQRPFLTGDDGLGAMTEPRWRALHSAMVELGLLDATSSPAGAWRVLQ